MKHLVALGIVLATLSGCSVDAVREDEPASTANADQAIAAEKFLHGRNLAAEDSALQLELVGVTHAPLHPEVLRLHGRNGGQTIVGDISFEGLGDLLFPSGSRSRSDLTVIVTRGDGATLSIEGVTFAPGAGRDLGRFIGRAGCPNACSGSGVCLSGVCACLPGYGGPDCSENIMSKACPGDGQCSQRGVCVFGACRCMAGYSGPSCELASSCPTNCSNHGTCDRGRCYCFPGFSGADCAVTATCPNDCSDRGICHYGKCFCDPGSAGKDCSLTP